MLEDFKETLRLNKYLCFKQGVGAEGSATLRQRQQSATFVTEVYQSPESLDNFADDILTENYLLIECSENII